MESSSERCVSPQSQQLHADLRRLDWAAGLSESALTAITAAAELVEIQAGETVVDVEAEFTHVYFLLTGRMQAILFDLLGKEIQQKTFVRGAMVGLFSVGLSERSHLQVQATEPSTALRLAFPQLLQLAAKHPDFQLALFRSAAMLVKDVMTVDRSRPKPSVVAIVHHTAATRPFARQLVRRLRDLDESPCVVGDDEQWKPDDDIPFRPLFEDGRAQSRQEILKEWAGHRRLLVDVRADLSQEDMKRLLRYVDMVLWCVRSQDASTAVQALQALEKDVPEWREKIRIVWLLQDDNPIPAYVPELYALAQRDFKVSINEPGSRAANLSLLQQGLERVVHHLRGIQIGLTLGGGAARGMAHLGVLKALQEHGIYFDMIAGTSAGAMTGTIHAGGLGPAHATQCFKTDLLPAWFFRRLPAGGYWYLLYKYRRRQFEPMLRKYLGRARLEQLIVPMFTIAVDLVEGETLVREVGDATVGILESINLPPLSLPIFASGRAMVDGGLLNNVPANVLVAKGCNFVIASTVSANLEKDFVGVRSKGRSRGSRVFTSMQVIMRQTMIQNYKMNSVGVQPADFVIAPDVTSFDLSEFTRADEMAVVGEATTEKSLPKLRKMLSKLDAKLFETA